MMRVIVSCGRGFNDQGTVQMGLLELHQQLKHRNEDAVLVVGNSNADKLVEKVWRALGHRSQVIEPDWSKGRAGAMQKRDHKALSGGASMCISFAGDDTYREGYLAKICRDKKIPVQTYSAGQQIAPVTLADLLID
jgi:hypothetical protein